MIRALCLAGLALACGCRAQAASRDERVVVLIASAEVKGTTEPCGCTSDPLGDVARMATLARGGLWLDAGSLQFDEVPPGSASRAQSDLKAQALATIYKSQRAEVGLGPDDLKRSPAEVAPARLASNVSGLALAAPHVRLVDGVKVGVFGVATPARVAPLSASEPVEAAKAAVARLEREGAQVIVALCGMTRAEARELLRAVPGIGIGVVGVEVGDGMPEAEPVTREGPATTDGAQGATTTAFLVAPADQGRKVARLELHVRKGKVELQPFAGEAARKLAIARAERRIRTLTLELAGWQRDPTADAAFVAARADELAQLEQKRAALAVERPAPPPGSYFTYELQPVTQKLAREPGVVKDLQRLYKRIGQANLAAARSLTLPPLDGAPSYVGMATCARCHRGAAEFWKHTVHAQAWKTLVAVDKQYNYDCTSCHVTGLSRPGGATLATVEARGLTDVQCEICHGPGSKHVEEDGLDEPRTIARIPRENLCADQCHTKEHSDTFQLEAYLRDILGPGHGAERRKLLGEGVTGHELRQKALGNAHR